MYLFIIQSGSVKKGVKGYRRCKIDNFRIIKKSRNAKYFLDLLSMYKKVINV